MPSLLRIPWISRGWTPAHGNIFYLDRVWLIQVHTLDRTHQMVHLKFVILLDVNFT